jgi:type IV secretion system protein VirB1
MRLATACTVVAATFAYAKAGAAQPADFTKLAAQCAPSVDPQTIAALVRTESGFNPYAIGVVGGRLQRQPTSLAQAQATVHMLSTRGFSYSVGLAQINDRNFGKYGLDESTMFDACRNLQAGAAILTDCFTRSKRIKLTEQTALQAALSCYYSGNFTAGFSSGYVNRVLASAQANARGNDIEPIPVLTTDDAPFSAERQTKTAQRHERAKHVSSPPSRTTLSSCHAQPVVMMCRGLSASEIHRLCLHCLDR